MRIDTTMSFDDIVKQCLKHGYDQATAEAIAMQVVQYRNHR